MSEDERPEPVSEYADVQAVLSVTCPTCGAKRKAACDTEGWVPHKGRYTKWRNRGR